jgi:hypothetical protein
MTTCANCSVAEQSATALAFLPLERDFPVRARPELAQPRQRRCFALAQIPENLVHHMVQAVRRLGLAHTCLAGHPFCDIRLLHPDSTLAAGHAQTASYAAAAILQPIEKKSNFTGAKH